MPLFTSSDPTDIKSVEKSDSDYLIFYSSVDAAKQLWCPDCRRVENIVREAFDRPEAPSALIIFVGQRKEWRSNTNNPFRGSPWNISSVPTILRRDGTRLVDDEINEESLKAFMKA